jgi:type IV pilus biogenesis protein PilP
MTMSEKSAGGGTPNKQKIIAAVVVVVFVIIVWQVIGLFSGGGTHSPAPAAPVSGAVTSEKKPMASMSANPSGHTPAANAAPQVPQTQSELSVVPVSKEVELYKLQQEAQQKYISSLNELQTLRIQKEIAETNQAIAAAKLATVSAEKNIADLLTKPVTPTLPPSAYAPGLATSGSQVAPSSQEVVSVPLNGEAEAPYVLISVSMQLNKWNAVIGFQGKPYQVTTGTVLPPDGSEVVNIDSSAVVLEKNGRKRKITLVPPV